MEFSSLIFIWAFLPLTLAVYYLLSFVHDDSKRLMARNIVLLVASVIFYAWGGLYNLGLLVVTMCVNYVFARLMQKHEGFKRKALFITVILMNVVLLVFFKYFNMLITMTEIFTSGESIKAIFTSLLKFEGTGALGIRSIAMPLAISFYTFQSISYLADVYKAKSKAETNPLRFALYMTLFAQMSQGPIMRYDVLGGQIASRSHDSSSFVRGIKRFCFGLGKKVLIANTIAVTVDTIWAEDINTIGSGVAWLGIVLYTLQIYYDFSGYTDMAIGVGAMFGFEITENFNYPYTSFSIQEFWRRWHMSLSFWFRDYIYIPLGGNRKGSGRTLFNLFMVFLLTGIWHGANLTFITWGLVFALFSVIERVFLGDLLKKNPIKPINWLYTTFVVMMGWVLFRAPNLLDAGRYFRQLFSFAPASSGITILSYLNFEIWIALIVGILFAGFLQRPLARLYDRLRGNLVFMSFDTLSQLAVLAWSIILIIGGSYNPSIYGKF